MKNIVRAVKKSSFLFFAITLTGVTLTLSPNYVSAKCACTCVNGKMEAVCSSSGGMTGMKPMCAGMCPMAGTGMPGMGNNSSTFNKAGCSQEQVWNEGTRRYEWKTVCRD